MNPPKGLYSFGEELRSCQLDGIRISETLMPHGLQLGEHSHGAGQICFILEGEYRERTRDGEHRLYPGVLQFHAPGESHSNYFFSESDVLTLLISVDSNRWVDIHARRPLAANPVLRECRDEIRQEFAQLDDAARTALEGWAILSLSALARSGVDVELQEPVWLRDAVAEINQRVTQPISLSTIAATVGVHRATLAAAFRRFKNTSVGEYIRDCRVRYAMRQLVRTKMPLCEIATKCGFYDQAHMGLAFRRTMGMSPGTYRSRFG